MPQLETRQAAPGGFSKQIWRIGSSLLPLAIFVGGAMGYEQVARLAPAAKQIIGLPALEAAHSSKRTTAAEAATLPAQSTSNTLAPASALPSLRDERSLLDLQATTGSLLPAPVAVAEPAASVRMSPETRPAVPSVPAAAHDVVKAQEQHSHRLGLMMLPIAAPGTYAVVRGVPPHIQLTHGIPVGEEAWLVDGGDLAQTGATWRTGSAVEPFELDVIVLSGESRVLARDRIRITAAQTPGTSSEPPVADAEPALGGTLPELRAAVPPASAAESKIKVSISPKTSLVPGRGSLILLDLEPAGAVPAGAYLVLRGLPEESVLSRGFPMGSEVWLLSVADLRGLEARLPARTSGAVTLDVRLISADGQLLAGDTRALAGMMSSDAPVLAALPVPSSPPVAPAIPSPAQPAARGAVIAPAVPAPTPPPAPSAASPPPAAQPVVMPAPAPAPQKALSSEAIALSRGRRMLEAGNIAIARPLLERAASAGSSEAASLLAASFDPAWLRRAGVIGIDGDVEAARRWWAEAQRLADLAEAARRR